jgi:hypothetical protein
MLFAMLCAAVVTAEFVSAKATRDALFLTSVGVSALPTMFMVTAACSILLVALHARVSHGRAPATLVPALFAASGALFIAEWLFRAAAPSTVAVFVYLHISGSGPLLASGFWLIVSERFNPRTAKKGLGRIGGIGTLGGLCGAVLAERVGAAFGVPTMLLILAAFHFVAAWLVRILACSADPVGPGEPADAGAIESAASTRCGLRVIAEAPYLRSVVALVLFGTTSAALLDYVFQTKAVETFGPGDGLLRFFAVYYAATSIIAFVLQIAASRAMLERFGLALATSTPSIALVAGSIGSLVAPGFGSLLVARGAESIFRSSWFRAGYELFYTPIPAAEKRAAKSLIDVGFDRLGDAVGGGIVRLAIVFLPAAHSSTILTAAMLSSLGAILAASHLNRWYLRALENSLVARGGGVDVSDPGDGITKDILSSVRKRHLQASPAIDAAPDRIDVRADPLLNDIVALRSDDRDRAAEVLSREECLDAALIPHVIPLLANDAVANYALFALRKVAEERIGELTDALLDPRQDVVVRRRLARVLSVGASQRAADALLLALDDARFDVRAQSARSLAAILEAHPAVRVTPDRVYDIVLREVAAGRPVWESRPLLDGFGSESPRRDVDDFVRHRAAQSLAHIFTLLGLVLPKEPLQIAYRSLNGDDRYLQGTALEYLEQVLPPAIRQKLWPFLVRRPVGRGPSSRPTPSHDQIIEHLLRSSSSITLEGVAKGRRPPVAGF